MGKKVGKWVGKRIKGALDGVGQTLKGVGQVLTGILTLDIEMIGQGLGNAFGGALNTISFGGWDALGEWVKDQFKPETPDATYSSRKVMARGADTPRQVSYGRVRVGGQLVMIESTGNDSQLLHMIIVVAPHQVHDIIDIYFNDDLAFSGTTPAPAFDGKAELIKVLGDQTTANADIVSRIPEWTEDHKLLGCAYVYVQLSYDRELYGRGTPNVSVVFDGKLVYDPRTETTAFSDNHALCCLDYLQSELGFRAEDSEIGTASFITGANICDELVPAGVGITEKRYTANGTISLAASPIDNLNSLLRGGAAHINYEQGEFSYIPGAYIAPPAENSFNEDDLVGGIQIVSGQGKAELTNTAKGTYIDARQDYEPVSFPAISPSDYVARDGEELVSELPMPFANTPTLARRLAKIAIEQSRFGLRVQLSLKWGAMRLVPGDRLTLSIKRFGWENKVFRVVPGGFDVSMGGAVSLSLAEDAPEVWGWTEGEAIDVTPPPALQLPVTTPIPAPTTLDIIERINTPNTQAADRVTLFLSVTPPADGRYSHSEFSYRLAGTEQWAVIGYERIGSSVVLPARGDEYEFRARPVSSTGRVWDSEIVESYTVFDRDANPAFDVLLQLPDIFGLRLINRVPNTLDQFKSGNAEFAWQARSQTISYEFGDDRLGADGGQYDPFFDDFRIRVLVNGVNKWEDSTRQPNYVLTLEENRLRGIGRDFTFEVLARGANGQIGKPERIAVSNPAPAAPTVTVEVGVYSYRASFEPPEDIDFLGFDFYQIEGVGDPYTAEPKRIYGNSITVDGLTAGQTITIGVQSVDEFGAGGASTPIQFDTRFIQAPEIGEITAPLTLDEDGGLVITNNDGYIAVHGVHSVPSESENPLVFSANDGFNYSFWVDSAGNAKFSGELSAATGVFGDVPSGQFIEFSGGVLQFGPNATIGRNEDTTVTVGSAGDYATINLALEALSRVVPAYKLGGFSAKIMILSGYVASEYIDIKGVDLSFIEIESEDAAVVVDHAAIPAEKAFIFAERGGVSPVISFSIDMSGPQLTNKRAMVADYGGVINTSDDPDNPVDIIYSQGASSGGSAGVSILRSGVVNYNYGKMTRRAFSLSSGGQLNGVNLDVDVAGVGLAVTDASVSASRIVVNAIGGASTLINATNNSTLKVRTLRATGGAGIASIILTNGSTINSTTIDIPDYGIPAGRVGLLVSEGSTAFCSLLISRRGVGQPPSSSDIAVVDSGFIVAGETTSGSNIAKNSIVAGSGLILSS